jgi:membrane-associated phospholipid phosphatase
MAVDPHGRTRRIAIASAMAAGAVIATEATSRIIASRFPDRPVARDLLYGVLPHVPAASYLTLAVICTLIVALGVWLVRHRPGQIPEYVSMVSLMYVLRAALTVLTPLAHDRAGSVLPFPLFENGLFPSGHTAVAILLLLLVGRRSAPRLHAAGTALLAVMVVTMLLSRGHYSIDIAGGALLAYFVWREWSGDGLFGRLRAAVRQ